MGFESSVSSRFVVNDGSLERHRTHSAPINFPARGRRAASVKNPRDLHVSYASSQSAALEAQYRI